MNNSTKCHSICPPLAWITCSSLPRKPSAALRRVSWGIFARAFSKELLRAPTDTWEEAQASASKRDQTQKSIGLRSDDEGGQTSLLQNPGKWSWHHFCVFLDVCDGAPFCWKMNGLSLKCFLAAWRAWVKIVSMYAFVFTFAPCGTKMRGDFHVFEMAAHIMTEEGFCRLKTLCVALGMSAENFARTLLFCRLQIALTVNNFSSEKMISLVSVPAFNLLRRIFARVRTCLQLVKKNLCSSQSFFFWRSVRCWRVCILRDDIFKSVLTMFLIVFSMTFMSRAIALMDLLGLRRIQALTALIIFGVQEDHGLPLRGRSLVLWSSLHLLTVW